MLEGDDAGMRDMAKEEMDRLDVELASLAEQLRVLMLPVDPTTMPLGFRIQTWPLAEIVPSICERAITFADPMTRLSTIELGFG
jgi:hypothetical protein